MTRHGRDTRTIGFVEAPACNLLAGPSTLREPLQQSLLPINQWTSSHEAILVLRTNACETIPPVFCLPLASLCKHLHPVSFYFSVYLLLHVGHEANVPHARGGLVWGWLLKNALASNRQGAWQYIHGCHQTPHAVIATVVCRPYECIPIHLRIFF